MNRNFNNKNSLLRQKFYIFALVFCIFLIPAQVFAIGYSGIGGRPAYPRSDNPRTESIFVHTAEIGQVINEGVNVVNNNAEAVDILVYPADSNVASGGGFACEQLSENPNEVGSWIKLEKTQIRLEPGTSQIIDFDIVVPENADVGENNACIVIQEVKNQDSDEQKSGMSLSFRTALRVALTVPGDIKKDLSITGFSITESNKGKEVINAKVKNLGNVSIDAEAKVNINTLLGKVVKDYGGEYVVLRNQELDLNFEMPESFWGGYHFAEFVVNYDDNADSQIGKQTNYNQSLTSKKIKFFIMPKTGAMIVYACIIILILLIIVGVLLKLKQKAWIAKEWVDIEIKRKTAINAFAGKYNVSWKLLVKVNKLKPPYELKSGDIVKIPPHEEE